MQLCRKRRRHGVEMDLKQGSPGRLLTVTAACCLWLDCCFVNAIDVMFVLRFMFFFLATTRHDATVTTTTIIRPTLYGIYRPNKTVIVTAMPTKDEILAVARPQKKGTVHEYLSEFSH
ncbi:hypothetical protein ACA910_016470 [Epithemia clementina (nom. ined.)]